jgi:hypothetical protein
MTARSISPSFIVVIRTAGERTFEACKALILRQVPDDRLHVVDERPFEAALRRCYQIGIESDAEWMITVDADVLLREGALEGLLVEASAMPRDYFQVEGMVFDKLTNRARWAGYRCYRTEHLAEAQTLVPADRTEIRPEFTTLERMAARGKPYLRSSQIYGVHDFEQYYVDVYRKAFVHAEKHQVWLFEMLEHWKREATRDHDFLVALRGAAESLTALEAPRIDRRDFETRAEQVLRELRLVEKPHLDWSQVGPEAVEAVLASATVLVGCPQTCSNTTCRQRLRSRYTRLGLWRFVPHFFGSALSDAGNAIKRLAERGQ